VLLRFENALFDVIAIRFINIKVDNVEKAV
jgi:hypothetical protein